MGFTNEINGVRVRQDVVLKAVLRKMRKYYKDKFNFQTNYK